MKAKSTAKWYYGIHYLLNFIERSLFCPYGGNRMLAKIRKQNF